MTTGDEEADRLVDDLFREVDDQFADLEREYHQAREEMDTADTDRRGTPLDALGASSERFELMSQVATLQAEVSRQRDELDERDRMLTELGDKIAGFEADIAKRDEMLTELRAAKQEALDERREQARLSALLDARAAEREELGEVAQRLQNERDNVHELLTTAVTRRDEVEAAMVQLDDKVRHLEAARDTAAHEHDVRAHELIESRAEMSKLVDQLGELSRAAQAADANAEKAGALAERRTNEAGYLNRRIDAMNDKIQASATFEDEAKNLRRGLSLNERRITELERELDTAQSEAVAANAAVDAIATRTSDYDELVKQVVTLEEERDAAWEAASGYTPAPPAAVSVPDGPEDVVSLADRARELGARRASEAELAAHAAEEAAEAAAIEAGQAAAAVQNEAGEEYAEGQNAAVVQQDSEVQEGTAVQEDSGVQEDTAVQEGTAVQEDTGVQEDTAVQEGTAVLKDMAVQEDAAIESAVGDGDSGEFAPAGESATDQSLPASFDAAIHAGAVVEATSAHDAEHIPVIESVDTAAVQDGDLEDLDDTDVELIDSDLDRLSSSGASPEAVVEFDGTEALPRIDLKNRSAGADDAAEDSDESSVGEPSESDAESSVTDTAEIPAVVAASEAVDAPDIEALAGEAVPADAAVEALNEDPDGEVPAVDAPDIEVPAVDAPDIEVPAVDAPDIEAVATDAEAPDVDDGAAAEASDAAPADREPEVIPLITLDHLVDADVPRIVAPESAAERKRTILPADLEPNTPEAVAHLLNQPGVTAIIDARSTCGRTGMRPSELFDRIVMLRDHFDVPFEVVVTPVSTPVGGAPDLPAIGVHHVTGADTVADRIRALCMGLPADQPLVVIAGDDHVRRAAIGEEANVVEPSAVMNLASG